MLLPGLIVFAISFTITLLLVPFINRFGSRFSLFDKPNNRKQHEIPIVRVGGLAIIIAIFSSITLTSIFGFFDIFIEKDLLLIFIFSSLLFLIGFLDDLFSISFLKKLLCQILVASFAWKAGLRINEIDLLWLNPEFMNLQISPFFSLFFTNFWVVAIINAFNWLDGLDGLATGITLITSIGLMFVSFSIDIGNALFLIFSLIGTCLGFLIYNYNPAKIFMGDGGSYLMGSLIAFLSIFVYNSDLINGSSSIDLITLLLILFVPLFDMTYVVFHRIASGKLPFLPDRQHIHHRLLRIGFSHQDTVIFCYLISIFFVFIALGKTFIHYRYYLFLISSIINISFINKHKNKFLKILQKININKN